MLFSAPVPFAEALQRLQERTPVASRLDSAEWSGMALGLSDRAFFSATVTQLSHVAELQKLSTDIASGQLDYATARLRLKESLDSFGYTAPKGEEGGLRDLSSFRRRDLQLRQNVREAREYGRFAQGQDPALLDAFPAQELIRWEDREVPRDWAERWAAAGGEFYGSRMIARKDSPVWTALSRFGRPWPPFDFGSGMGVEDVDRATAEQLGVIAPLERVAPTLEDYNQGLEASLPDASPALLAYARTLFGDQVDISRQGKITWQGQRILGLFAQAIKDPNANWSLDLGRASARAVAQRPELADARLVLKASELKHIYDRHMLQEPDGSQRPLTKTDLQLIPHVWRSPAAILPGKTDGTLEFRANLAGWQTLITFNRGTFAGADAGKAWGLRSFWAKKEGVSP